MENLKPRFSICIPTWECGGRGVEFLHRLVSSLESQTFKNYEIIVSDHSDINNKEIFNYLHGRRFQCNTTYDRNVTNIGNSPANTNNAIKHAKGEIVKIMFQDDIFYSLNCLSNIDINFDEYTDWMVVGCNHTKDYKTFFNSMVPSWNDQIVFGNNTISSPSVLAFRNKDVSYFDENLVILMDCDYYYQLYNRFGEPKIIPDTLISNGIHENQISVRTDLDLSGEVKYIKMKYRI